MKTNTCCFIGHRTINETDELISQLYNKIEGLITEKKVDSFLFGSKSKFNDLCYQIVTNLKEKYNQIKRIYVRAEYPDINEQYTNYLLERYEDTYYPEHIIGSGRVAYIERNYEMINKSNFCVFYYDETIIDKMHKSGTEIALKFATKQCKEIIMFPHL